MIKNMTTTYEHLRQAILDSGKSRYRISKETGISQGHLCELMAGTKGLSIESAEKLAEHLGWEIIARPKKGKGKTKATPSTSKSSPKTKSKNSSTSRKGK